MAAKTYTCRESKQAGRQNGGGGGASLLCFFFWGGAGKSATKKHLPTRSLSALGDLAHKRQDKRNGSSQWVVLYAKSSIPMMSEQHGSKGTFLKPVLKNQRADIETILLSVLNPILLPELVL